MSRYLGLLIASSAVAAAVAACSAGPDTSGTLYGGTNGHSAAGSGTPGTGSSGSGSSGSGNTGTGGDNGGTPAPSSTSPTPVAPPPPAGPASVGSPAHQYFVASVYPTLTNCAGCHGTGASGAPKMMETNADTTYSELDARGLIVSSSLILTKGTHAAGAAPALSTAQQTVITQWLQLEAGERQGQAAPVNVLAKLGACLDETLFNKIGLQNLRTVPRTNENPNRCTGCDNANCRVCHTGGDNGFYEALGSNIDNGTFAATKTPQYIVKYFGLNGVEPVASNAIPTKALATQTGAPYTHPMFKLDAATQAGLDAFVNDAIAKYKAGTCTGGGGSDAGTD